MKQTAIVLLAMTLIAAGPCQAATRGDVYVAMQRCNVITDNRVWLDCVYGAMQPMRAELKLPPAPEGQVRLVPQGPASMPDYVPPSPAPVTHPPPKKENLVSYMMGGRAEVEAMPLRAYNFDGNGHFTVTLANGQVWRQMNDDNRTAYWKADPGRYIASIKTGSMGSSILEVKGEPSGFMVKQVQ